MQVIVERATQISKFSYEDSEVISATHTNIIVGDPTTLTIWDLNCDNTNIYKDVKDVPSDFIGDKYLYDGYKWSANPTWVDPSKEDE